VLDDVSMTVMRGEKVALVGANGAGKSTLAKILAGEETPDGGSIAMRRGLSVRYLAQEPVLDATKTARETVEEGLAAWKTATARHQEIAARIAQHDDPALAEELTTIAESIERLGGWDQGHRALSFLDRLGVTDVERDVGGRSGGERRRIALARLLVARPDVAILDEPTNHLDADAAEWLEDHLAREFAGAVVLVTHDRYFLEAIATRIVELERGKVTSYDGGFTSRRSVDAERTGRPSAFDDYLEKKAQLLEHEDRVEANRQNALRREREWLSRGPKARTTKQKARIQRAKALEAETPANVGRGAQVELSATSGRLGKTILECRELVFGVAGRDLVAPFELFVAAGDRIGIVGPNGIGKTTFLRVLQGEIAPTSGEVVRGKNTSFSYLDQARAQLDDALSIFDDVKGDLGTTVDLGDRTLDLRSYLELFLFDASKQRQKVGALSGGERARVALAKMLRRGANVLLFDEPTNDLDLPTLGALEDLLLELTGCAIVVTHDRAFLDRVATHVLAFDPRPDGHAIVELHGGGWTDYRAHLKERERRDAEAQSNKKNSASLRLGDPLPTPTKRKALTWAEKKELETILEKIDAAEGDVKALEATLADPSTYATRGAEVAAITARLDAARAEAQRLVARWEELESKNASESL
jgi:ATP-binding cassette subfamily F protein uup